MVKFYEGAKGIKQILKMFWKRFQSRPKEYYLYSSATAEDRKNVYEAMPDFSKKSIAKKNSGKNYFGRRRAVGGAGRTQTNAHREVK